MVGSSMGDGNSFLHDKSIFEIFLYPIFYSPLQEWSLTVLPALPLLFGAEQVRRAWPLWHTDHLVAFTQSVVISHSVVGLFA